MIDWRNAVPKIEAIIRLTGTLPESVVNKYRDEILQDVSSDGLESCKLFYEHLRKECPKALSYFAMY